MKFLIKNVLITMIAATAMSSIFASNWKCKVHNTKGQVWYGSADYRKDASSKAMAFCARNTKHVRNCIIDWCTTAPVLAKTNWLCYVSNSRGQTWHSVGNSRGAATINALRLCASNSKYGRSCLIRSCSRVTSYI